MKCDPRPFEKERGLLPELPRIQHLPYKPNTDRDDLVATEAEARVIFDGAIAEEKIDGSQVGILFDGNGEPIIRNKNHVLRKGYGCKGTPAKDQYAPLFNWTYAHRDEFAALAFAMDMRVAVYGEWLYAEHTICYDLAPDDFIAHGLRDVDAGRHVATLRARAALAEAGFSLPVLLATEVASYERLTALTLMPAAWSTRDQREGVVVKVDDGEWVTHLFKMRRATFKSREDFNVTPLRRRGR